MTKEHAVDEHTPGPKEFCPVCKETQATLLNLLQSAPPMRSIEDPRYQAWKLKVDRALEQ